MRRGVAARGGDANKLPSTGTGGVSSRIDTSLGELLLVSEETGRFTRELDILGSCPWASVLDHLGEALGGGEEQRPRSVESSCVVETGTGSLVYERGSRLKHAATIETCLTNDFELNML